MSAGNDSENLNTERYVQRAKAGDRESLDWIIRRFTPALLAQAHYRLRGGLRSHVDPEDLVSEVWAIALSRLGALDAEAKETAALLKFLSTTLLYRVNNLVRKELRHGTAEADSQVLFELEEETQGVVTRAVHSEERSGLMGAIEGLGERDREVVVLRGIEQVPNGVVAQLLGETPNAISLRYGRALEALRRQLPESVFGEL